MIANKHESTMRLTNSNENKLGSPSVIVTVYNYDENERDQMQMKWRKVIQYSLRGSLLLFAFIAVYILFVSANSKSPIGERNSLSRAPNEGKCWICDESILKDEPAVTLHPTCKHKFCVKCHDGWYLRGDSGQGLPDQTICAACKAPVTFKMRTHCIKCKNKFEERKDGEPVKCATCKISSKQIVGQTYGDVDQTGMSADDGAGISVGGYVVSFVLNLIASNPCMAKSIHDAECTTPWFIFGYLPAMFMLLFMIFFIRPTCK